MRAPGLGVPVLGFAAMLDLNRADVIAQFICDRRSRESAGGHGARPPGRPTWEGIRARVADFG
jgi:hypothetical protein